MNKGPTTVHLYPVAGVFIPGVPHVEGDYELKDAATMLAYKAFTTEPPRAEQQPEEPAGSSDMENH